MSNDCAPLIRSLIRQTGMDVLTLSTYIGASEKSIYKWMNGTSKPSFDYTYALLKLVYKFDSECDDKTL